MDNRILNGTGLVAFCAKYGEPVGTQECEFGDSKFNAIVFKNPLTDTETLVGISSKLPADPSFDYLVENAANLQVCQIEPDPETIARREARRAQGLKTQMESYVLCPVGNGAKRHLFKGSLLAALGIRTA